MQNDTPNTLPQIRPMGLILDLLRPYRAQLAGGVAAMVISSAMMLAIGWGLKGIVDRGFADTTGEVLNRALLMLMVVILLMSGASYVRLHVIHRVAERVIADLRKRIYAHLLSLDPEWFEQNKTGDQISKINADTTVLQMLITTNLPSAFRHFLMLLGGTAMLFMVSPGMTAKALIAVPFVIGPAVFFGRRVRSKSRDTQSRIGDISSYSLETIQGLQTIQSFGYEGQAEKSFGVLADDTYHAALKYIRVRAVLTAFVIAVVFGAIGVLLWSGGHKVLSGEMTGGDLSAFIFYSAMVAGAVAALSEVMSDFNRAKGSADRIIGVLNAVPSLKTGALVFADNAAREVVFDDVSFNYPSRPEQRALSHATFTVEPGKTIALVGPSGAGKTTIFQLLQRFYDPQQGSILIDGKNIAEYAPQEVRRILGVVAQDPAVFSTSVADNIRLGKHDATDAEIRHAAELAQAHEFILALPQGYDTLVGERGSRLSGGQKQRIAIARALLKNPKILLLDEATSALDAANESAVHIALKNLMQGRTTLIIAHRLSTVQGADKIIVLDKGVVVAQGSHAELYNCNALYTHLAALQMDVKAA